MSKYITICYILPYFGLFPKNFHLWLLSCEMNPTINWIIFTDNHSIDKYPPNIKVIYTTFEKIREKIQSFYDFKISCEYPWRLSLFKPAYGEIFAEYLKEYDFWGYCDCDLIWGDIRHFYTNDILNKYDRIGNQGHSTIIRNNPEVINRYKTIHKYADYREHFSKEIKLSFDEKSQDWIYKSLNIDYFDKTIYAHLCKYEKGFYLGRMPKEDAPNNKYQIFTWENGKIYRHYLKKDGTIEKKEFLYIHFFCRPIKIQITKYSKDTIYYMYPDIITNKEMEINAKTLKKYGTRNKIGFIIEYTWQKRKKISLTKIVDNIKSAIIYHKNKVKHDR